MALRDGICWHVERSWPPPVVATGGTVKPRQERRSRIARRLARRRTGAAAARVAALREMAKFRAEAAGGSAEERHNALCMRLRQHRRVIPRPGQVLLLPRIDAAVAVAVDYGWPAGACLVKVCGHWAARVAEDSPAKGGRSLRYVRPEEARPLLLPPWHCWAR